MAGKYQFIVNGQLQSTDEKKPLLRYLRDDLQLFSVKDGCSEGACGTCTFVCPTCQCYDIKDYNTKNGVQRYRCWVIFIHETIRVLQSLSRVILQRTYALRSQS